MVRRRVGQDFFQLNAVEAAPLLLGKVLCRKTEQGVMRLEIRETEAYYTEEDTACHAHKGRTKRTEMLYRAGGCAYIYLCYGMYNLLNVITGAENVPQGVLIRGAGKYDGPGKLTRALLIDRSLNGIDFLTSKELWLEEGRRVAYRATPRIGINYASEEYRNKLWRFVTEDE